MTDEPQASIDELSGIHTVDAMVEHLATLEKEREIYKDTFREADLRLEEWHRVINHAIDKLRSVLPPEGNDPVNYPPRRAS